jgi:CheY-like chemotaxis protein/two-component sensor histidine kinase
MTDLVNDLLDVSRVTKGLIEVVNAPLDIRQVIADSVEQVTPKIQARRHHLTTHISPDAMIVAGDQKRLVQVVTNILNNAAKYTPEGGNLLLKTEVLDSDVTIDVVDDGIGMAPELVTRVFELFSQAERTLGLGLALAKSLIELHGGTVACESEGIGKGSKFTVRIPRLVTKASDGEFHDIATFTEQKAKSLRVLVVDDNMDAATMLAMLLEASGHQVMVEYGAWRALKRATTEAPQVCLVDVGLPEMNGNELARRLRAQPETATSRLIAVTGYGQESDRKDALAAGFDHHLVKPVDAKELNAILAKIRDR